MNIWDEDAIRRNLDAQAAGKQTVRKIDEASLPTGWYTMGPGRSPFGPCDTFREALDAALLCASMTR